VSSDALHPPAEESQLDLLIKRWGLQLKHIVHARNAATGKLEEIKELTAGLDMPDTTSLVVFGSLARGEWTSGSDVDWTLLVDGPADPQHFRIVNEVAVQLAQAGMNEPGKSGTFGAMVSGHELVHQIGGDVDSNANMTRRTLLLLESASASGETVRGRVIRTILDRYIVCGPGVAEDGSKGFRCPRFLLNDVVRLWRTIAVDYAAKKWYQADQKWALRNAKLRISRKLTFVKGLLLCLDCELFAGADPWGDSAHENGANSSISSHELLVGGCLKLVQLTPLEGLARVCLNLDCKSEAKELFEAYDEYLALIGDAKKRDHLVSRVAFEAALNDPIFKEVREISHRFANALELLFFDSNEKLTELTKKYGVF